jgi:CMP/dCMP kinase
LKKIIIAIDGPAASGKSTTAKLVAKKFDYLHIDTGAMYRAMALKVLRNKVSPSDAETISQLAKSTVVRLARHSNEHQKIVVMLDGEEVHDEIRLPEVTNIVSPVSTISAVRELMVKEQRAMGNEGGIVLEGRDIGTVVFPKAELKIFLQADVRERARRRQKEFDQKGIFVSFDKLENELLQRDNIDSHRDLSPLKKADDAVELDTTYLTIDQQVEFIVEKAKEIIER